MRFLKAYLDADMFSWSIDEDAVARADLFDGKLAVITNAPDLAPAEAIACDKGLPDIERGFMPWFLVNELVSGAVSVFEDKRLKETVSRLQNACPVGPCIT